MQTDILALISGVVIAGCIVGWFIHRATRRHQYLARRVIIYTIADCKFSREAKQHLREKGIAFEERNIERGGRKWLPEMLAVSDEFAGTPVIRIIRPNGRETILKGFRANELDAAL